MMMTSQQPPQRPTQSGLLLPACLLLMVLVVGVHWGDAIDDAYISFRYADNLVAGEGLVFNAGEQVEGYSNFLWVLLLAVASIAGAAVPTAAQALGLAATLGSLLMTAWWAGELLDSGEDEGSVSVSDPDPSGVAVATWSGLVNWFPVGVVALFALDLRTGIWAVSGLETPLITFLVLSAAMAYRRGAWALCGLLALLLALLRPEGLVVGGALLLWRVYAVWRDGARPRVSKRSQQRPHERLREWLGAAIFVVGVIAYTGWRWWYFGALWPTTAAAKVDIWGPYWGGRYLIQFALHRPVLVGLAGGALVAILGGRAARTPVEALFERHRAVRADWAPLLLAAGGYVGALLLAGGDWMPHHRFLVPGLPVLFLLALYGASQLARPPAGSSHANPKANREPSRVPAEWARALGPTFAAACIVLSLAETTAYIVQPSFHKAWHTEQDRFYSEPARWVREHMPPEALVALGDIGHIAYRAPIRVIDTLGLVNPHLANLRGSAAYTTDVDYVLRHRPDAIIRMVNHYANGAVGHVAFDRELVKHPEFTRDYRLAATLPGYAGEEDVFGLWTEPKKYVVEFEVYLRR